MGKQGGGKGRTSTSRCIVFALRAKFFDCSPIGNLCEIAMEGGQVCIVATRPMQLGRIVSRLQKRTQKKKKIHKSILGKLELV